VIGHRSTGSIADSSRLPRILFWRLFAKRTAPHPRLPRPAFGGSRTLSHNGGEGNAIRERVAHHPSPLTGEVGWGCHSGQFLSTRFWQLNELCKFSPSPHLPGRYRVGMRTLSREGERE